MNTNTPVIQLESVTKIFNTDGNSTYAVRDVTIKAFPGEMAIILGPSGSGKTTLLTLMAGLIESSCGTISLFGKSIEQYSSRELQVLRATNIGFVFQTFHLIDFFTALENISLVLRFGRSSGNHAKQKALDLLRSFSIEHLSMKLPGSLSQGEKQRVAIARAVANNPILILADEPTANLDSKNGRQIINLLHSCAKKRNTCVIIATHDTRMIELADRIHVLEDGRLLDPSTATAYLDAGQLCGKHQY